METLFVIKINLVFINYGTLSVAVITHNHKRDQYFTKMEGKIIMGRSKSHSFYS